MSRLFYIVVFFVTLSTVAATAGELRQVSLTTGPWMPFTGKDLPGYGHAATLVSAAFRSESYGVEFHFRPWMRAYAEAKAGRANGSILWRRTGERESHFWYSEPVLSVDIVFFHLKSRPFDWETLEDLLTVRIGVVRGFKYEDRFDRALQEGLITAQAVATQEMNFRKLLKGRIDVFPVVKDSGHATIATSFSQEEADRFTQHPKPLARHKLYLILTRHLPENERILADFNRGLARVLNRSADTR
ncbi:MAG: transporter substrate-binding domain-containing protein [Desulfobacterales bacterium]|nr:transporter substrate-binding domain-containing protein [Desulfobacterales bacterium]